MMLLFVCALTVSFCIVRIRDAELIFVIFLDYSVMLLVFKSINFM